MEQPKNIVIEVSEGLVSNVYALPKGWSYVVMDLDVAENGDEEWVDASEWGIETCPNCNGVDVMVMVENEFIVAVLCLSCGLFTPVEDDEGQGDDRDWTEADEEHAIWGPDIEYPPDLPQF